MTNNPLAFVITGLVIAVSIGSCQRSEDTEESISQRNADVKTSKNQNVEFQKDTVGFTNETNGAIAENERRIGEFRNQVTGIDARYHAGYYSQLDKLERRNREIAERVRNFDDGDNEESWMKFSEEVKRDLADLTSDLQEFAVENRQSDMHN